MKYETVKWIRQYKDGDKTAFNEILNGYRGYIRKIAEVYKSITDTDALYWEGAIGLHKALEAFDPDGGKPFKPFASKAIKNAILDAVRDENNTAEARLAEKGYTILDLDEEIYEDSGVLLEETIPDPNAMDVPTDDFEPIADRRRHEDYAELRHLSNKTRSFLDYRFGIFDSEPHTLAQTARHFGIGMNEAVKTLYDSLCEYFMTPENFAERLGRFFDEDPDAIRAGFMNHFKALPVSIRKKLSALEIARPERDAKAREEYMRIWYTYDLGLWQDRASGYPPRESA